MANQWFYARNNQQAGPITWEQLQQLAATGAVAGSDLIWTQGMSTWLPAATVPGLFAPPAIPAQGGAPYAMPYPAQAASPMPMQGPYGASPYTPGATLPYAAGQPQPGSPWLNYDAQNTVHFAGFWIRLVAMLIDVVVLVTVYLVLKSVLGITSSNMTIPFGPPGGSISVPYDPIGSPGWWLATVTSFAYYAWMESSVTQGTLGKMAVGVKVVDIAGNRITFARALGRRAGKILSELTIGIGYLMAAFTGRKQALHDMIASTLVVYK
jgi:uncharacterized RDD family membrane protein YckC